MHDNSLSNISSTTPICSIATPPGGAIGIVRVSGTNVIPLVDKVFSKNILQAPANTTHYGEIKTKQGVSIDQVVLSLWHAPHSYTGEDTIEISCHGSAYILQEIIQLLIEVGCRQAEPGEFTQRAFFNGKLDLSQAEAVADLISSTSKASSQLALSQLKGHFSSELSQLRAQLLTMTSLLELELDFSDHEELEFADRSQLNDLANQIAEKVESLIKSFKTGQALKKGIPVAIIGKTNVGKSTLLNCLLRENKAIVSNIHGTTRDIIEDTFSIKGVDFLLIDTAGIRKTEDKIEQIGIKLAYEKIEQAHIVLWVIDEEPTQDETQNILNRCQDKKIIVIRNKVDTSKTLAHPPQTISTLCYTEISAKLRHGIGKLEDLIYNAAEIPEITENTVIVTNARHYQALVRAKEALKQVADSLAMGLSGDLVVEDLKPVLEELGKITGGEINSQETLKNIFKNFCIGK